LDGSVEMELSFLFENLDADLLHDFLRRMVVAEDPQSDPIKPGNVLRKAVPVQRRHSRILSKFVPH
jgi:hypothetical protein